MKSVAITGSFASGKSFVLKYLEKIGYKIFSCDDYVKQLYLDSNVQEDILSIIDKIGKIFDKKRLIEIIYNDDNQRKKLENYIHPKVRKGIIDFICVYCNEENREKRAKARGDFNLEIYNKIRNIQLSQEAKTNLADFQINTDTDIEVQISKIIDTLNEY